MTSRTATLTGFAAILLWSFLATLTVATGAVPPFQLAAMTFALGALTGPLGWTAAWLLRRERRPLPRVPALAWAVGVGGLFGYHALYFLALRLSPPAEAGLINYLWPLLIVLFSALLPGERLAWHHLAGVVLGLAGTVLLFAGRGASGAVWDFLPGFAAAFVAAFVWATYSVSSRLLAGVPTEAVAGFCLATALLAALFHLVFEIPAWPATAPQWLAVLALGLGPVGLAFYAWDIGMKRGDIRVLGAASYAAPLISTLLLVLFGYAEASRALALSAALIAAGGVLAAKDMLMRRG
ncbi:MAG: DMT family transporter [Xanthobacteraceae bacterium]|nr:MAG: DMT family transporter [Xanthobacteraceae bacterium]